MPNHPEQPFGQEKRRHPRLMSNIPVKISGGHGDILTETLNLSSSGAFCRLNKRFEPMTKLKVHLLLPFPKSNKVTTRSINCEGVIVRVMETIDGDLFDTAIFFSSIAPKDSRTIKEFIEIMMENKNYGKLN